MTPESLKNAFGILDNGETIGYKVEDVKFAVEGLIKFHEDRIEKYIKDLEEYEFGKDWLMVYINWIDKEYESIMAIEHWLEDVI
jgi:hypothetical protein